MIANESIATLALADDKSLLSNNPRDNQILLDLSVRLSSAYNYQYAPSKTKILVINPKPSKNPKHPSIPPDCTWTIDGTTVHPSSQATHLGVVRSDDPSSNTPALLSRIAAHQKAFFSTLSLGLSKNHRTSPATALKIESVFCSPILFSGLSTLLLKNSEIETLNSYSRKILRQIMKLHKTTSVPALHLLSGSLPAEARLHLHQFSLLRMVSYLGDSDPLYRIAVHSLTYKVTFSWFRRLVKTAIMYQLPHPLWILLVPPSKLSYKQLVYVQITKFWTDKYINSCTNLPSLKFFRPASLSLGHGPHPLFTSCRHPHDVRVATIQAKMLCGTYRSCWHSHHWQRSTGRCLLPNCGQLPGDTAHLFTSCTFLRDTISQACQSAKKALEPYPFLHSLFSRKILSDPQSFLHFLLDPSSDKDVQSIPPSFKPIAVQYLMHASRCVIWPTHRR